MRSVLRTGQFYPAAVQRAKARVAVATRVVNGQYNASKNAPINVSFPHENLADDVALQPSAAQGFDRVMLASTRVGAAGEMSSIVKPAPERVEYVSCSHDARTRRQSAAGAGYRLARMRMLDRFPHTGHLASVAPFTNTPRGAVK